MSYRIDIKKKKDSFLPEISFQEKEDMPRGALNLATLLGAEGGYGLGALLTAKPFEDSINKQIRAKANSLYESAGRRVPGIIDDITNGNRVFNGLPPKDRNKIIDVMHSSFFDKILDKLGKVKRNSSGLSYLDAARKAAQSAAEARMAGMIEKGVKGVSTPMGRFGKRVGMAISGALLARMIVKKYYE